MSIEDKKEAVVNHLDELRKRLIWILAIFVIAIIAGFVVAEPVVNYFQHQAKNIEWNVFSPADGIKVYMQFAFMIALVLTFPLIMYHLWKFISPGLRENERKAAGAFILPAFLLFIAGLLIGYYLIFPMLISFMVKFSTNLGAKETFGIAQYFSFMFNLILPFALLFELPVVVMFLTRLRILNPARMSKIRGYAYLALIIVASLISPPDFISHLSVFIPLVLLYEISIMVSRVVYRKQLKEDEEWEKEFNSDEENDPVLNLNDDVDSHSEEEEK